MKHKEQGQFLHDTTAAFVSEQKKHDRDQE